MVPKTNGFVGKYVSLMGNAAVSVFPFMVFISYFLIAIETYTYIGALRRYLWFDSNQILLITIIVGIIILVTLNREKIKNSYIDLTLKFNILLVAPIILGYYALVATEALHYPNYVFTTYHIQPNNFLNFLYINSFCLIMYAYVYRVTVSIDINQETAKIVQMARNGHISKIHISQLRNWKAVLAIGLVVLSIHYGIDNFTRTLHRAVKEISFIIVHPTLDDNEKYQIGWTFVYDFLNFVKEHTPEDATIAFPPAQNHWLTTGNTVVVRYFLYPRKIVNIKETQNIETLYEVPNGYDYIVIAKGEWDDKQGAPYGWPKKDIDATQIWYFEPSDRTSYEDMSKIFKYRENQNDLKWGLIKVK